MNKLFLRITLALLLIAAPLGAQATVYYVATWGVDSNSGTNPATPFLTPAHAISLMGPGDSCLFRSGVFHTTLLPSHSGSFAAPIFFSAYSNESVTFDGADAVTGWTAVSNGIYEAAAPMDMGMGFNEVFVDGAMIHQAQFPPYGSGDVVHPGLAAMTIAASGTNVIGGAAFGGEPVNYWAGAWFSGGVGLSWAWQSAQVVSSSGSNLTMSASTETPNWWFTGTGSGFLFGELRFLTSDNQWDLESAGAAHTLYLRITGGADPTSHTVEIKDRNWCLDMGGCSNIVVSNLNFWAGAIRLNGYHDTMENCQAQYLSHYMIITQGFDENGGIEQGDGVELSGGVDAVLGCTIANTAGCGIYTSGVGNLISRNSISNTDYSGDYACGIALHGTAETMTFNTLSASGRDVLRPEGAGSDIRFNDLSEPGLLCKDLGPVYAWGTIAKEANGMCTRIAYNWIHDNNHPSPSPLVYLDNYHAYFIVDHNVIWNTGGDAGVRLDGPCVGDLVYNNTLFNCADVGSDSYDSWPSSNPDPAFWTADINQYSASNNLWLASSPNTQLMNWTNHDFRLIANAPAIDAGVVIPGYTDGYAGRAPDLGAYESGCPAWTAGVTSQPTLIVSTDGHGNIDFVSTPDAAFYQLCATTNLAAPNSWGPVATAPTTSDYEWNLTLPLAGTWPIFYRLEAP